jgi:uncharacterized protein (TIGR03437 family)
MAGENMALIERFHFTRTLILAGLAITASGQSYHFDNSGNATLKGQYFVREVVLQNVGAQGSIGQALSVLGVATFDGAGNYAFNGQLADSTSKNGPRTASYNGSYSVAANGFLKISSFAITGASPAIAATFAYGGVGAVGPSAFTASATENSRQIFDLIVAIPIGASTSNANLAGAFNAVYLNFPQATVGQARQAYMPLVADGAGGFGAVTATGSATDNASLTKQTIPGVTYSLSSAAGTINFGAVASNQLIGGTQSFFVSADRELLVGGSPGGFDILLASPAASPSDTFQGFYYLGGLEADNSVWSSQAQSLPDAFYGSMNSTGQGSYTSHLRLNSNGYAVEDLTSGWHSTVQADGSFTPGDGDQYWLGAKGQVVLALGQGNLYSIVAGLHAVNYAPVNPTDVFLNPLGIVNAASFAPPTNAVAPQEMVTIFGSNMSIGSAQAPASTFPLPTTLSNTRVLVNGVAAPLLSVSPTQITMLVPSVVSPDLTAYAAFEVQNLGVTCPSPAPAQSQCPTSKLVTMYTNYSAPGVFSLAANGFGPAASVNTLGKVISASNPAKSGDFPLLFVTGLGSVTPALADGVASSPNGEPLNWSDLNNMSALSVYFDGYASPNIQFAGVVPGYAAGLYQINAQVPDGVSNGDDYLDILTPDAEAEQVTLTLNAASSAVVAAARRRAVPQPIGRGQRAAWRGPVVPPKVAPASR